MRAFRAIAKSAARLSAGALLLWGGAACQSEMQESALSEAQAPTTPVERASIQALGAIQSSYLLSVEAPQGAWITKVHAATFQTTKGTTPADGASVVAGKIQLTSVDLTLNTVSRCKGGAPSGIGLQTIEMPSCDTPSDTSRVTSADATRAAGTQPASATTKTSFGQAIRVGDFNTDTQQVAMYIRLTGADEALDQVKSVAWKLYDNYNDGKPIVRTDRARAFELAFSTFAENSWTTKGAVVELKSGESIELPGVETPPWKKPPAAE